MRTRDLTRKQFEKQLQKFGFKKSLLPGYWEHKETSVSIYEGNGATIGPRGKITFPKRRMRLSIMLREVVRISQQIANGKNKL